MLLKNFDHSMSALMAAATSKGLCQSVTITGNGYDASLKTTNGAVKSSCYLGYSSTSTSEAKGGYLPICLHESTIVVGDGDTPVTYEDYKMSGSNMYTGFTAVSNTVAFNAEKNCWVRTLVTKYTNSTDSDVVFKEWGIWRGADSGTYYSTYNNNSAYIALTFREVLPEPITVAANSTATLTFTLDIPHEINKP